MPKQALNPLNPYNYRRAYRPKDVTRVFFEVRAQRARQASHYLRLINHQKHVPTIADAIRSTCIHFNSWNRKMGHPDTVHFHDVSDIWYLRSYPEITWHLPAYKLPGRLPGMDRVSYTREQINAIAYGRLTGPDGLSSFIDKLIATSQRAVDAVKSFDYGQFRY